MAFTFLFAGGGTGGHLFPGLAIAEELRALWPELAPEALREEPVRCMFLCSDRAIDRSILEKAGAEFVASPAKPLASSVKGLARFVFSIGPSVRQARGLIRDARSAGGVHVVAMGGFVAAPAANAARVERVGLTLVNLDSVPGKANRWIGRRADRVISAMAVREEGRADFPRAHEHGTYSVVPPIVRSGAINRRSKAECAAKLGLDPAQPTLMVTGGSQGARSINDFVVGMFGLDSDSGLRSTWQVIHQTGVGEAERVRAAYQQVGVRAVVTEFVDDMATWWGAADLAVARSGAGNVLECWANRVPALFLPYPFHKDEHQKYNALALVDAGTAKVVKDHVDGQTNVQAHAETLRSMMDATTLDSMRQGFERLGPADGAARVARLLIGTLNGSPIRTASSLA